nr:MAG: 50 kDa protein [Ophiovirus lactucae]
MSGINVFSNNSVQLARMKGKAIDNGSSLPVVSFRKASEHMINEGIGTLVSLKGGNNFSEEIECMASEFKEVIKGEIKSIVSPITIKLKDSESTTKVKITTMDKVTSLIKFEKFPFYRVDRLKILYIPLFSGENSEGRNITFSIQDRSMVVAGKPKKISSATAPINKMSMIELSATYFVQSRDLSKIEFGYKAKGIPVSGRSFAAVYLAFYIHGDHFPATMRPKDPIVLLIDDVDAPTDINKTSSVKDLCDKVHKRIESKSKQMNRDRSRFEILEERRKSDMLLIKENVEENNTSNPTFSVKENDSELFHGITKANIAEYLPRNLPISQWENAILDTGAPDHWCYHPNIVDLKVMGSEDALEEGVNFHRVRDVEVKLGVHWIRLREVLFGRKDDRPLISYNKLMKSGIIDSLNKVTKSKSILCCEGKVMFDLDTSGGYQVFIPSESTSRTIIIE